MERVLGNIFIRTMSFEKAGEVCRLHKHNFDHATLVLDGSVRVVTATSERVLCKGIDGATLIKAGEEHEITALEDNTICCCIFAHRDPDTGEVVERWNGWMDATR